MRLLTKREQDVLRVVREIGADGWPVSVREVQIELGYASTENVHRQMVDLTEMGILQRSPRSSRSGWRVGNAA